MADVSDVEEAIADACAAALQMTSAGLSAPLGLSCRVTREWPNDFELQQDLDARTINITVTSLPGMSRETTRYPEQWKPLSLPVVTISGAVTGNTVTLSSSATPIPVQLVGIRLGGITGTPCVYQTTADDTPASIAAALAALVPGASSSGSMLTAPTEPLFRVAGFAPMFRELRRQRQSFKAAVWAPDGASRDAACSLVDQALAGIHFLTLSDRTAGRLQYEGSYVMDASEKDGLWRRDLRYSVEYATTQTMSAPAMLWGVSADLVDGAPSFSAIT